jgi:UDP-N-acetylmuramate--alanine ligase
MKIFCSGIGGIGLSAYAALRVQEGHTVLGSDRSVSAITADLQKLGVNVGTLQDGSAVPDDIDLFVYSEAIPKDAPERKKAAELGVEQQSYFQALGELSRGFHNVAVCGTHGKSSTTSMAAKVLMDAGRDPTVVVGTRVPDLQGRNWHKGASDLFLLEACEYRRSFHFLSPSVVLMTNVDGDHFDAYSDLAEYQQAFVEFLKRLPEDGIVITHGSDPDCMRIAQASGRKIIDADTIAMPELTIPGQHMRQNAQLVLALAAHMGIGDALARKSLLAYRGCWRRLERKGETGQGNTVFDDYGHHPREVRATLAALREVAKDSRIICVFQPHTHARTISFYDEFLESFGDADTVIIPNIYEARSDIESARIDVDTFVQDLKQHGVDALNGRGLTETQALLEGGLLQPGDVLLCMGAGDITTLAEQMTTRRETAR